MFKNKNTNGREPLGRWLKGKAIAVNQPQITINI